MSNYTHWYIITTILYTTTNKGPARQTHLIKSRWSWYWIERQKLLSPPWNTKWRCYPTITVPFSLHRCFKASVPGGMNTIAPQLIFPHCSAKTRKDPRNFFIINWRGWLFCFNFCNLLYHQNNGKLSPDLQLLCIDVALFGYSSLFLKVCQRWNRSQKHNWIRLK